MGRLTQLQDTGRNYTATVTNDWNGKITEVGEDIPGILAVISSFTFDNGKPLPELAAEAVLGPAVLVSFHRPFRVVNVR